MGAVRLRATWRDLGTTDKNFSLPAARSARREREEERERERVRKRAWEMRERDA